MKDRLEPGGIGGRYRDRYKPAFAALAVNDLVADFSVVRRNCANVRFQSMKLGLAEALQSAQFDPALLAGGLIN